MVLGVPGIKDSISQKLQLQKGVLMDNTKDEIREVKEWEPTPLQSRFARLWLDASQRRTHEQLATEIGVHRNTIQNWLNKPEFSAYLSSRRLEILDGSLVDIYKALVHKARSGDFNSMRLVLEMSGSYTPGMKVETTGNQEQIRIEVMAVNQIQEVKSEDN